MDAHNRPRPTSTNAARILFVVALSAFLASTILHPPIARADTQFSITGRGWGHGIGLSQWGAQGYAKDLDWDYQEIITHYFQHTRIEGAPKSLTVRVNLDRDAKARTSWRLRSGSASKPLVFVDEDNSASKVTLSATAAYWVTVSGGNVRVQSEATNTAGVAVAGKVIKTFTGAAYATTGGSSYLVQLLGTSGPFSYSGVRWRGTIHFTPSGTSASKAINFVGMEQYLYGVVPRESPASFEPEALKAQAVAARSYAYTSADKGQTLYCTVQSQVYGGHSRPGFTHEDARTTSAVNATHSQVVKYGAEVVRTYFSSSAGGHTANIEDVWVISDPKPYYVGVASADAAYPNGTTWGAAIKLSGSSLATKVRAYDWAANKKYDYSVAAPATVTSISLTRAGSGFVSYLDMRWSNGSVFHLRGTTFQSVLSLKSTKFYIGADYPPPLTTRRYQESDARIAFAGSWNISRSARLSGGAQAWSGTSGASVTMTFKGSGMRWVGNKAPAYGRASVYVDGTLDGTVDLYASAASYQRSLWSVGGLSVNATHTVQIRVLNSKNAASHGYNVALDAVDVYDGSLLSAPQPVVTVQEHDARLAYAGDWLKATNTAMSGDAHVYATEIGSRAVIKFFGRGIRWVSSTSPFNGAARVSLDEGTYQQVSLRAPLAQYQKIVWSKSALALGTHTVIIEVAKPATSGLAGPVPLDAVQVVGGALQTAALPWQRIQETAPSVTWAGTWSSGKSKVLSGGSQRSSAVPGAKASFYFSGTSVHWIGARSPSYGKASVSVDGGTPVVVDLYASKPAYEQVLFSRSGLPNRAHTLNVRVLGVARAGARGKTVGVDAFDVVGVGRTP